MHRYQIEAAAKIIGGLNYSYALRGDGQLVTAMLQSDHQLESLDALLQTMQPEFLTLNESLLKLIPPRASGRGKTRESFKSRTGLTFDAISLAETAATMTAYGYGILRQEPTNVYNQKLLEIEKCLVINDKALCIVGMAIFF